MVQWLSQALLAELVRHVSLHYSTMDRHHIFGLKPVSAAAALPHLTPSSSKGGLPTLSESAGLAGAGLVDVKASMVPTHDANSSQGENQSVCSRKMTRWRAPTRFVF